MVMCESREGCLEQDTICVVVIMYVVGVRIESGSALHLLCITRPRPPLPASKTNALDPLIHGEKSPSLATPPSSKWS